MKLRLSTALKSVLAIGIATLSLPSPSLGQADIATIAAGTAVNQVIDNLRSSVLEILDRLDQSVSSGTFLARMQANTLLSELDYYSGKFTNNTFEQLDKTQQTVFVNMRQSLAELQSLVDNSTADADKIAQRFEFLVGTIPLTSKEPRLRTSYPRVVTEAMATKPLRITFDGSWLANAAPRLVLGDTECKPTELTEPTVTFECPAEAFAPSGADGIRYVSGLFSAAEPQSWWERLLNFMGRNPDVKSYQTSVGIVQNDVGKFAVKATALVSTRADNSRNERYDTGARHCVWGSETTLNVSPSGPEWTIDVNSIHLVLESGEMSKLQNVTPKGFQVYAVGHNSGSCVRDPITGTIIARDGRGWANGYVTFTEFKSVDTPNEMALFEGTIPWGDRKVVELPDRVQTYLIDVVYFDKAHKQYNSPETDEFLAILRDAGNKSLSLAPKPLKDAFR